VHGSHSATLALRNGDLGLIVKCFAGCDPRDVLAELRHRGLIAARNRRSALSKLNISRAPAGDDVDDRIAAGRRLWYAAHSARSGPVACYLAGRGITIASPASLRYAPCCWHSKAGRCLPAMVAAIVDVADELIGVHRTYLRPDGSGKADVEPAKAMLGRVTGGAVRLAEPDETLLIGEGIETCLAAMQATEQPAWAALSAGGIEALCLPAGVRQVIILADNDANGRGQRAARAAADRWLAEGRRARLAMPPQLGTDFNDVLLGRAHARIAEARGAAA
jgi:hypothetical protein